MVKKTFAKLKKLFLKNEQTLDYYYIYHIKIRSESSNLKPFKEVVKIFCDEYNKQLNIKLDSKKLISQKSYLNGTLVTEFILEVSDDLTYEQTLAHNSVKKVIQSKIKDKIKYKDIFIYGSYNVSFDSKNILNLKQLINENELLNNYELPLVLNVNLIFCTSQLNKKRFIGFIKKIESFLNLKNQVDFLDAEKRLDHALENNISENFDIISKKEPNLSKDEFMQNILQSNLIRLIYTRTITYPLFYSENVNKKIVHMFKNESSLNKSPFLKHNKSYLKKLNSLNKFMKKELRINNYFSDRLITNFSISTDFDFGLIKSYGCYSTIDTESHITPSLIYSLMDAHF